MTSKSKFKTEQESFWAGEFGDHYTDRNQGTRMDASNLVLFSRAIGRTQSVRYAIEFGANRGLNMVALRALVHCINLSAIEINPKAVGEIKKLVT